MTSKPRTPTGRTALCAAALFCAASLAQAAQTQPTNRPPAEVIIPKSIFVTNDAAGKDPFFPNSTRPRLTADPKKTDDGAPPQTLVADALRLLGITTDMAGKRIALINNLTFAQGEEHDVRVGIGKLKVRCVEIREKSVLVSVVGQNEQYELVLPEKVLPTRRE